MPLLELVHQQVKHLGHFVVFLDAFTLLLLLAAVFFFVRVVAAVATATAVAIFAGFVGCLAAFAVFA